MQTVTTVACVGLFVVSVVACLLPRYFGRSAALQKMFPLVTVFTAGIQLATILVDLVPHMEGSHGHSHGHGHEHKHAHKHAHSHGDLRPYMLAGLTFIILLGIDSIYLHGPSNAHGHGHGHTHSHGHNHSHAHAHGHEGECAHSNIGTCNTMAIAGASSTVQALVTLGAVSFHSLFEGLAVNSERLQSAYAAGLLLHKLLESFAVGLAVVESPLGAGIKTALLLAYSALTPAGMMCADYLAQHAEVVRWCTALSLGSLLFVVCVEMIGRLFAPGKASYARLVMLATGYLSGCVAVQQAH